MKRIVFLLAAFALLASCSQELRTEKLEFSEDIPFHEGSKFFDSLNYDIEFPTAGFSKAAIRQMRREIRTVCLGEGYTDFSGSLDELKKDIIEVHKEDYVSTNQELLKELEIEEDEAVTLDWGSDVTGSFGEVYGNYINYRIEGYQYFGGAHGLSHQGAIVLDKKTGKAVPYETFTQGVSRERLMELLDEYKCDKLAEEIGNDFNPEEVFYVDTIEPGEVFSVGAEGITFYYDPYELAPYVFGGIEIRIPWDALKK